jgi:hypothetical protein
MKETTKFKSRGRAFDPARSIGDVEPPGQLTTGRAD